MNFEIKYLLNREYCENIFNEVILKNRFHQVCRILLWICLVVEVYIPIAKTAYGVGHIQDIIGNLIRVFVGLALLLCEKKIFCLLMRIRKKDGHVVVGFYEDYLIVRHLESNKKQKYKKIYIREFQNLGSLYILLIGTHKLMIPSATLSDADREKLKMWMTSTKVECNLDIPTERHVNFEVEYFTDRRYSDFFVDFVLQKTLLYKIYRFMLWICICFLGYRSYTKILQYRPIWWEPLIKNLILIALCFILLLFTKKIFWIWLNTTRKIGPTKIQFYNNFLNVEYLKYGRKIEYKKAKIKRFCKLKSYYLISFGIHKLIIPQQVFEEEDKNKFMEWAW